MSDFTTKLLMFVIVPLFVFLIFREYFIEVMGVLISLMVSLELKQRKSDKKTNSNKTHTTKKNKNDDDPKWHL